ncbi:MAG: hypothetical protein KAI67_02020 [Candidatus Pacebacteria bacterium]|nr:hypothetical protein [Candidatus Paceibacterota bacterium]
MEDDNLSGHITEKIDKMFDLINLEKHKTILVAIILFSIIIGIYFSTNAMVFMEDLSDTVRYSDELIIPEEESFLLLLLTFFLFVIDFS